MKFYCFNSIQVLLLEHESVSSQPYRMTDRNQPTNRASDMVQDAGDRSCPLAVSGIRTLTPKEMPQKSIILIKKKFRVPRKQTYVINKEAENGQVQDDSAAVS